LKKNKTPFLLTVIQWIFPRLERIAPVVAYRLFTKIFFTPLNYRVPEKELATESKAKKFSVEVGKKKIQCYSWGTGPVVLVLHGWAGRATQFRKFIEVLSGSGYRVVGFDGPAHGRSQGTSTDIFEFEEALKKVCNHTGVPRAIIAHSFGGSAVLFAAMNGLEVKKLINIASPTIGDEIIYTYLKTIGATWKTGNYFKSYIKRRSGKTFDEFTSLHFIRHLRQETELLLVHDTDDDEVSIAHAREMVKIYPRAVLYETSGLGHTRILRDEGVIRRCVTFIEEIRP
jgi:predicted alpha/beta hydrolase family esterase